MQKDTRFLRAQVIGSNEARLLPVVIANHPTGADSCATHNHDASCIVEFLQSLSRILSVPSTGASNDQTFRTGSHCGLGQITGVAGATMLGDGRVPLILDIPGVITRFQAPEERGVAKPQAA